MKILLFTSVFAPSVGGIETLAELLCREFHDMGHEVRLATPMPGGTDYPFQVIRAPSAARLVGLLAWCDIHAHANVALKYAWMRLLRPSRTIYQHNNAYQRDDGSRSRLDELKAAVARCSRGIAVSHFAARRTGAGDVILNAYDDEVFSAQIPWEDRDRDLIFVGRLVSQKGGETLIRAAGHLRAAGLTPTVTVVGSGPERPRLEALARDTGVADQVSFAGTMCGPELAALLNRHRVIVVPSLYEEPFGIVAVEGLACGCVPVVSARGGLMDAVGLHGFSFPNGDDRALSATLTGVLKGPNGARSRLVDAETHLSQLSRRAVAERYIEVFKQRIALS